MFRTVTHKELDCNFSWVLCLGHPGHGRANCFSRRQLDFSYLLYYYELPSTIGYYIVAPCKPPDLKENWHSNLVREGQATSADRMRLQCALDAKTVSSVYQGQSCRGILSGRNVKIRTTGATNPASAHFSRPPDPSIGIHWRHVLRHARHICLARPLLKGFLHCIVVCIYLSV